MNKIIGSKDPGLGSGHATFVQHRVNGKATMSQNTFKKRPQDGAVWKCIATRQKAIIARPSNIITLSRVPAPLPSRKMFYIFNIFLVVLWSTIIYLI